ncbi:unnamed protein product, partial [Prorocentrum cordatum]
PTASKSTGPAAEVASLARAAEAAVPARGGQPAAPPQELGAPAEAELPPESSAGDGEPAVAEEHRQSGASSGAAGAPSEGLAALPSADPRAAQARAEALEQVREAELELAMLAEELEQLDGMHMAMLTRWVEESTALVHSIGGRVVDKAQKYYDCEALLRQATRARDEAQASRSDAEGEHERARANLQAAESALEAFLLGEGDLSDEQWARLAPLTPEAEHEVLREAGAHGAKLARMLRVSSLSDRVAQLRSVFLRAEGALDAAQREVDEARRSFEAEAALHARWARSSSSSVVLARPFYRRREEAWPSRRRPRWRARRSGATTTPRGTWRRSCAPGAGWSRGSPRASCPPHASRSRAAAPLTRVANAQIWLRRGVGQRAAKKTRV